MLAVAYAILVRDSLLQANDNCDRAKFTMASLKSLFSGRSLNCSYVASGLQLFVAAAIAAWLPTYFVRYYDLPLGLSLIHISEPTRLLSISYAVFCLKK